MISFSISKTAKNIIGVYFGDILSKGIAVITTVIIIRTLSKEDYGLYTNFLAVMNLIGLLVATGLNSSTARYASEYISLNNDVPSNVYASNLGIQLVFYVPLCFLLLTYSRGVSSLFFGTNIYSQAVLLGGLAALGVIFIQIVTTIFQAKENFRAYVSLLNARQAILLGCIVVLWMGNYLNFNAVAYLTVFSQILFGIILIILLRECFAISNLKLSFLKEFFKSSGMLIIYNLFLALFSQMGIFMISRYKTAEDLAVYGVAYRYYGLAIMLLGSIHAVLLPKFSRVEYLDSFKQREIIFRWLKVSSLSVIPVAIIALSATPLFLLLSGKQYLGSVNVFRVFCVGVVISLMFSPLVNILIGKKKFAFLAILSFIAFALNFAGNLILIEPYGIMGVTTVEVITYFFLNISIFVGVMLCTKSDLPTIV